MNEENQKLKEQLEKKYKEVGTLTNEILYEENTKLLSVLDEIREQLKKIKPDLDFEPWSIYKVSGDKLFDLLQILDKVKE